MQENELSSVTMQVDFITDMTSAPTKLGPKHKNKDPPDWKEILRVIEQSIAEHHHYEHFEFLEGFLRLFYGFELNRHSSYKTL